MSANVTAPPSDGGSPTGLPGDRVMRGTIARWASSTGWVDRDGLPLPKTMLVIGYITVLRRWKEKRPEYISEHPLPDPDVLNKAIPITEWETGLDGKPRRPWALTYVVYLVDLKTGALYTYAHDTYGAMQAYNALEEQIAVMRMLRGEHVFPIVQLEQRPWKSQQYGMLMRPHFQVVDWRYHRRRLRSSPDRWQSRLRLLRQPKLPLLRLRQLRRLRLRLRQHSRSRRSSTSRNR